MQEVSNQNQEFRTKAIISPPNYICGHSTNSLTPLLENTDLEYYLGIINSKAFNYYYDYFSYTNHITVSGISQIPIPKLLGEEAFNIESIVSKIINMKEMKIKDGIEELERKVDQIVYHLYGLTDSEIKIIEKGI